MELRRLNEAGRKAYERFVKELRAGTPKAPPMHLLTDKDTSEAIEPVIAIDESRRFTSRYDLGTYLVAILEPLSSEKILGDAGIWDAIALVYFDQLCPRKTDGSRTVRQVHNYCLSDFQFHRVRHAIYMTYLLVERHAEHAQFMLSKGLETRGELMEQIMSRQYYLTCEGVVGLASSLYLDPDTGSFKRGAAGRSSPGCVARFVSWLQQIENTFDLWSMSSEELKQLLPAEFSRFSNPVQR